MKLRKSFTLEYGVYFFVIAFCLLLYLKINGNFQNNIVHLQLLHTLSPGENSWADLVVTKIPLIDNTESIQNLLSSIGQNRDTTTFTKECNSKYVTECDDISESLYSLALWHFAKERKVLGNLFILMNHIYHQNDEIAVPELLSLGAEGILLSVGGILNDQNDLQRAALYLEANFTLHPMDYPIIYQLTILYLKQERYCDLISVSSMGVDLYDSSLFYYYLGRGYDGLAEWQVAAEAYEQALARFPGYQPYETFLQESKKQAQETPENGNLQRCDELSIRYK